DEVPSLQLHGVDVQVAGDLLQVQLQGEPRLRRAVAALGAAWRLVGEDPAALEAIGGDVVGDGLQRACIEGRGDTVRTVGSAVQRAPEVHRDDAAVARDARAHPHQYRVPAAMGVEHLLAGQRALDGPAGEHRELGDDDL